MRVGAHASVHAGLGVCVQDVCMSAHDGACKHEFVCAYARVFIFMHANVCAHLRLSASVCVHMSVSECVRKRLRVCMHTKLRAYECEYKRCVCVCALTVERACINVRVSMHDVFTFMYAHARGHLCVSARMCVHAHTSKCVCEYARICVCGCLSVSPCNGEKSQK